MIAAFERGIDGSENSQVRHYLHRRQDVLNCMITMHNYKDQFLPNALRKCFAKLEAPNDRGAYLQEMLSSFSKRFCQCNPELGYSVGEHTRLYIVLRIRVDYFLIVVIIIFISLCVLYPLRDSL